MSDIRTILLVFYKFLNEFEKMSAALDALTAAVAAEKTVVDSAIALLGGLESQLDALIAAGNPDPALASLAADLGTQTAALSAAVTANTPVAPQT